MEGVSAGLRTAVNKVPWPVFKRLQANVSSYLQSSGSQEYAGTGDGLRLEPHKHISPQGVVHVVPRRDKTLWLHTRTHGATVTSIYLALSSFTLR